MSHFANRFWSRETLKTSRFLMMRHMPRMRIRKMMNWIRLLPNDVAVLEDRSICDVQLENPRSLRSRSY